MSFALILLLLSFPLAAQDTEDDSKPEVPFRWLRADADLEPTSLEGSLLRRMTGYADYGALVETESETVQVDENTTRTVLRAFRRNPQGKRILEEVMEETRERTAEGGWRAVKTVSRSDINGRQQVTRREIQEVTVVDENTFQTRMTTELPSPNRNLREVERIEQTQKTSDGVVEMNRVQYVLDGKGDWDPSEQRSGTFSEEEGTVLTREEVFRKDGRGKMVLMDRYSGRQWEDDEGVLRRTVQKESQNFDGRFEPVEYLSIARDRSEDSQTTVQELSTRPVGSDSGGMTLVQRIVESQSEGLADTSVEGLDMSGVMKEIASFRTSTSESSDKKKSTRKVKSLND